jgi:hypothetical protein
VRLVACFFALLPATLAGQQRAVSVVCRQSVNLNRRTLTAGFRRPDYFGGFGGLYGRGLGARPFFAAPLVFE